jgi:hypothetical protein
MHLKRGRYYYGRNQAFLGDNLADAMLAYGEREAARAGRRPTPSGISAGSTRPSVIPTKARGRARTTWTSSPCCSGVRPRAAGGHRAAPRCGLPGQPLRPAAQGPKGGAAACEDPGEPGNRALLGHLELGPGHRPDEPAEPLPGREAQQGNRAGSVRQDEELQAVWAVADEPLRTPWTCTTSPGQRVRRAANEPHGRRDECLPAAAEDRETPAPRPAARGRQLELACHRAHQGAEPSPRTSS